ncbi:MAG: hypothetical protein K2J47_00130 [Ruminococcus sp.]|nr:hypothetical protein [Ruminococcus sp.]
MYNKLTEKDRNILVDGKELTIMLLEDNEWDGYYYELVSSLCNENMGELRYIKELVSRKLDCNFPLLICDCDCDFNCTVAVAKVKFCDNCVKWEKIGIVTGTNRGNSRTFFENYRNSGIRRVEDWAEDDWQKYGDIAYDLIQDDYFFHDWCSKNWQEELYRRCWGYYHKYFNDDLNISWASELNFKFEVKEYQKFFCGESI